MIHADLLDKLREENRKLRKAAIRWRAIADYGGDQEGQDYELGFERYIEEAGNNPVPENSCTWGRKEYLDQAESELRAEGVIE